MILARQKHLRMILASNFPLWDFFWGNTCSECPFFSVILLFCYSAVLLFCCTLTSIYTTHPGFLFRKSMDFGSSPSIVSFFFTCITVLISRRHSEVK